MDHKKILQIYISNNKISDISKYEEKIRVYHFFIKERIFLFPENNFFSKFIPLFFTSISGSQVRRFDRRDRNSDRFLDKSV